MNCACCARSSGIFDQIGFCKPKATHIYGPPRMSVCMSVFGRLTERSALARNGRHFHGPIHRTMSTALSDSAAWHRLAPYLDQALDLDPGERERWLVELALTKPDVAAE